MSHSSNSTSTSTASTPGKMTNTPSPNITPLHDPAHQARVLPQQKPLGVANPNPIVPGQTIDPSAIHIAGAGQKALLAKKFAKANKPTVSPTDQMQSPCTAKLSGAKQRHFAKGKPSAISQSLLSMRSSSGPSTGQTDF